TTPGVIIATVFIAVWLIAGIFRGGTFGVLRWDVWNVFGVPTWMDITFSWIFWIVVCVGVAYLIHLAVLQHGRSQRTKPQSTRPYRSTSGEGQGFEAGAHPGHQEESRPSFSESANESGHTMSERAS